MVVVRTGLLLIPDHTRVETRSNILSQYCPHSPPVDRRCISNDGLFSIPISPRRFARYTVYGTANGMVAYLS